MDLQPKGRQHLSEEQKEVMISFMEMNGDISSPIFNISKNKKTKIKLINELAKSLNSCKNGVVRTPKNWLRSWNDNKCKSKAKAVHLVRLQQGKHTGTNQCPLNDWEERILNLVCPKLAEKVNYNEALDITEDVADNLSVSSNVEEKYHFDLKSKTRVLDNMSEHNYHIRRDDSSRESTPVPKQLYKNNNFKDEDIHTLMVQFIKVQQETNAALLQLATSFREGCKELAESCNNIAVNISKHDSKES